MTFSTPRRLSRLAAKSFVENLVLESKIFMHFPFLNEVIARFDIRTMPEEIRFDNINDIRTKMNQIVQLMNLILRKCCPRSMESILNVLRTTDHVCYCGAVVLQILLDNEIYFRRKHWILFPILNSVQRRYPKIEKLVFDCVEDQSIMAALAQFLCCLPNLKVFKGVIMKEGKLLPSLKSNCPKLKSLTLIVKEKFFSSNQLSSFFFSGRTLDSVKKAFVKLETVPLSFPALEQIYIGNVGYEQYDFFKMFLHFYKNVNFSVGLHYSHLYFNNVSWFDAVLSHSIMINPDLCVNQCELNVNDLFLPFCEKSLVSWRNLDTLLITLGAQGKMTPATSNIIGRRLEAILGKQDKIRYLSIRTQGPVNDDEITEIVIPSLKSHGKRFRRLKILGIVQFISHRSLVQILNLCPNTQQLVLIGKRIVKLYKDVKLKPLPKLESLTTVWSETSETSTTYCQLVSKLTIDMLRIAPNLKILNCSANIYLMQYMNKMQFGSELRELSIYFHIEKSCDRTSYLKRILSRLPKLEQLVMRESRMEKYNGFMDEADLCFNDEIVEESIYDHVKKFVDRTQIHMRYHTFEDAVAFCL